MVKVKFGKNWSWCNEVKSASQITDKHIDLIYSKDAIQCFMTSCKSETLIIWKILSLTIFITESFTPPKKGQTVPQILIVWTALEKRSSSVYCKRSRCFHLTEGPTCVIPKTMRALSILAPHATLTRTYRSGITMSYFVSTFCKLHSGRSWTKKEESEFRLRKVRQLMRWRKCPPSSWSRLIVLGSVCRLCSRSWKSPHASRLILTFSLRRWDLTKICNRLVCHEKYVKITITSRVQGNKYSLRESTTFKGKYEVSALK